LFDVGIGHGVKLFLAGLHATALAALKRGDELVDGRFEVGFGLIVELEMNILEQF
jgi:hypothetical protein